MIRLTFRYAGILALACCAAAAQKVGVTMPDGLVIARDEFWDMGPPNDYYDLIQIKSVADGLVLDQVVIAPHGQACFQPATVEERTTTVHKTMAELLEGRNPCAIQEKELHKELKRCKHCLTFSGVNVTMQADCGGKDRQIRMDILDRDIYDRRTQTPANTSWTMNLLAELNGFLGPDSSQKPMFSVGPAEHKQAPDTPLVRAIGDGKFDGLFGPQAEVPQIVHEASLPPPPPPSVVVESVTPAAPISPELPKYPPIARAAHVEGLVQATFDVSADGKVQNIVFVNNGRLKMLEIAVSEAISKWIFPQSAWGKTGSITIRFALNC